MITGINMKTSNVKNGKNWHSVKIKLEQKQSILF